MTNSKRRTPPVAAEPAASGLIARFATEPVSAGREFTGVLRTPHGAPALALMGIGVGLMLFLLIAPLTTQALAALYWLVTGRPGTFAETYTTLIRYEVPFGLIATHLGLAMLIPITLALMLVVHRVRPSYVSSVHPGLRWRFIWPALALAFVTLLGVLALQNLTAPGGPSWQVQPQPGFTWFVAVVLVTSPLQAAAEEYFFRGYLMQAFGSMVATPWFGIVTSAAVFTLFHGVQNPALIVDRFAFGVLAGVLVWRTGGLEAGIAAHTANNVSAFVLAALTSSVAEVKAVTVIGWADAGWDLARFGLFAVAALGLARVMRLRTVTVAPV